MPVELPFTLRIYNENNGSTCSKGLYGYIYMDLYRRNCFIFDVSFVGSTNNKKIIKHQQLSIFFDIFFMFMEKF